MNIIKNVKRLSLAVSSFALLAVSNAAARDKPEITPWTGTDVGVFIMNVATQLITWSGAICVLMIIWGGITYMTAGADTKGVENGKNIVKAALIGLIIILACSMVIAFIQGLGAGTE